ncbi:hypothetical protein FRB90_012548 [Tulasnella sp. 427]|nr:hypothetical protein FRB90_012548 [Tulasnella sp. 427]
MNDPISAQTYVAEQILRKMEHLPSVVIMSQDSFYNRLTPEQSKTAFENKFDFDHPNAIDLKLFAECLADLKSCKQTNVPKYSFTRHQREDDRQYLYGAAIIIVEGILALHDPGLRALYDLKIFVQCDSDLMLARRIKRDTTERGRDVEGILDQYLGFVKPSYDNFVYPSSKYADIIVPGHDNTMAIELIVTHVKKMLQERSVSFRQRMARADAMIPKTVDPKADQLLEGITVVPESPQVKGVLTLLRDKNTNRGDFIFQTDRLATIVIEKAMELVPFRPVTVETPVGVEAQGKVIAPSCVCGVSILRSGGPLEKGLQRVIRDVRLGCLLIQSDPVNGEPLLLYSTLPSCVREREKSTAAWVFLLDAQIVTGAAAFMVRIAMDGTAATALPQNRSPLSTILFFCLILYLTTRPNEDPFAQSELLESLQAAKHVYGNYSAWLNGTESNYTERAPNPFLEPLAGTVLPAHTPLDPQKSSYWSNMTGFWNGQARLYNLSNPADLPPAWSPMAAELVKDLNQTEVSKKIGVWNWTEISKTSFRLSEPGNTTNPVIQPVHGHLDLETSVDFLKFEFNGLHFPATGSIVALMNPNGSPVDIRDLPPLVSQNLQNATRYVVLEELRKHLDSLQKQVDFGRSSDDDNQSPDNTETTCQFAFYGHLRPCNVPADKLKELEDEMQYPTGISTVSRPPVIFDGILISPDCAVLVELNELDGMRVDRFWRKVSTYAGLASLVYLSLLILLVRQMENTRTPATISPISRWCFIFQSLMDSFSFTSHTMFGILTKNKASVSMVAPGFLACILALMFEIRYTSLIHRVQAPEDEARAATRPERTAPSPAPSPGVAPLATAASPPRQRFELLRRIGNGLAHPDGRVWVLFFLLFILVLQATSSNTLLMVALGVFHSMWVPQIVRNVSRGTRKALQKRYVVGTTVLRTLLVLYYFVCPENILLLETNPWVYAIILWLGVQVMFLVGQEYLGAHFFIPRGWVTVPEVYDYHPNLMSDPEAPEQNLGDCAICLEPIVIRQESASFGNEKGGDGPHNPVGTGASLLLNAGMRRQYAFTPCSHIMHTACLEQWMRVKSICPSCRTPLPPL